MNKIEDLNISKKDDKLLLSFRLTYQGKDMTKKSFSELASYKKRINDNEVELPEEGLTCRLHAGKIEMKENKKNSDALLMVPIVLMDLQIISEENKNALWDRIKADPLLRNKPVNEEQLEFLNLVKKTTNKYFPK